MITKDKSGLCEVTEQRSDYLMAKRRGSQQRRRKGVPHHGAGADYHYRGDGDWLWMSEIAWDLYRNNMAVGSITDRAIDQQLQGGFRYDPNTGDEKIDADLKAWWDEVSIDPSECDPGAELTFSDQEEIVLRSMLVAGDVFGIPRDDGTVDIIEGHRSRSPSRRGTAPQIIHGIEYVPGTRRRAAHWFTKDTVDPFKQGAILKRDLQAYDAWTDDGERNVFHARFSKRVNQTRGITAYAPLFDVAGYHDDVQYLKMVQARAASLFVFVRQRHINFDPAYTAAQQRLGPDVTQDKQKEYRTNERQYEEVAAGSTLESLPGETIDPWSSNVPNPEFFEHSEMLLQFIGINLGMPLVMALMKPSGTFSSYRGAVDQARMGFKTNQQRFIRRWHTPYMRFKILRFAEENKALMRSLKAFGNPKSKAKKVDILRHRWNPPAWPYIEPTKDATADLIRDANMLTSPRRRCQERGMDYEEMRDETIADRSSTYLKAVIRAIEVKKEAAALGEELSVDTHVLALQFAPQPTPERTTVSIIAGDSPESNSEGNNVKTE